MSNAAIKTDTDSDAPVPRLLTLERLLQQEAEMSPAARGLAHEAAVRMFDLDPEEVGLRDPGSQLGPYRIVRLLGCGGQALVYEAEDTDLGRRVALKVPRPGVGDRLVKEARAVGALSHPNVVRVEALREQDGQSFLVMELCDEGNLYDLLEGHPEGLPLDLVKRIGDQVLAALTHAHAQGVVHRDVKPGNVLFSDGVAKLGDFGIGKRTEEGAFEHSIDASQMTQGAVGTPLYMAPEQRDRALLRGQPLDGRTDLYGFGRMLWYMVTGRTPDDYQPASRARPGLDVAWDELIWGLTERERSARPEDAESVRGRLMFLPGDPPPRTPVLSSLGSSSSLARAELLAPHKPEWEKPPHLRKHNRRKRWRKIAGAAGLLLVLLLGAVFFSASRRAEVGFRHEQQRAAIDAMNRQAVTLRAYGKRPAPAYAKDSWATRTVRQARKNLLRNALAERILIPLKPVVRRYPGYAEAWSILAETYARQGDFSAAQHAAERARSLDTARYGQRWFKTRVRPWLLRVPAKAAAPKVSPTPAEPDPADSPPSRQPRQRSSR